MIDVRKLAEQAGASLHVTTLEGSTMWVASGEALTRFAALVLEEAAKVCITTMKECDADNIEDRTPYMLCAGMIRRMKGEEKV